MKKYFCLCLILVASAVSFAQEKTIDQVEFNKVYKNSFRGMDQPRRETITGESVFEIIPPTNLTSLPTVVPAPHKTYTKSVTEFSSGKFHSIYEFNSESLNSKKETIRIADKTYTREGNGKWAEAAVVQRPKPEARTKTSDAKIEYKYLGSELLNNQKTSIYAKIETSELSSLTANRESFSTITTKYWFGEDGRLIKTESNRVIRNDKTVSKFQSATVYESDPNIKIEAPNLN